MATPNIDLPIVYVGYRVREERCPGCGKLDAHAEWQHREPRRKTLSPGPPEWWIYHLLLTCLGCGVAWRSRYNFTEENVPLQFRAIGGTKESPDP
ncbi:MAG TPA: hypothetical protein VN903_35985 [Polyangia bacterium]|nr:hypothetical protein [Polyangia bacterium]